MANLKKLAAAMGGNMVIVANKGTLNVTTINSKSRQAVGTTVLNDVSMDGFAVKVKNQ